MDAHRYSLGFCSLWIGIAMIVAGIPSQARRTNSADKEMEKALSAFKKLDPHTAIYVRSVLRRDHMMKRCLLDIASFQKRIEEMKSSQAPDVKNKAEEVLPRLEKKLNALRKRLAHEVDRYRRPYQRKYDRLKKREERYQQKADELDQKGIKNDSYLKRIDRLQPDLHSLDSILSALKKIEELTVDPDLAASEAGAPEKLETKPKAENKDGLKRIPW